MDWYATGKKDVIEKLKKGKYLLKDIDIKGLISIKEHHPDVWEVAKSVFLDITEATMVQRIHKRGVVSEEVLTARLATAAGERELAHQYCTDVVDASGTIEEEFARVYAVVAGYVREGK